MAQVKVKYEVHLTSGQVMKFNDLIGNLKSTSPSESEVIMEIKKKQKNYVAKGADIVVIQIGA